MLHEGFQIVASQEPEPKGTLCPETKQGVSWEYAGLSNLRSGLPPRPATSGSVDVCAYRVGHINAHAPFVLFALHRDANELRWPQHACGPADGLIASIESRLVDAFATLAPAPSYRGWRSALGKTQLWFQLECARNAPSDAARCNGWRWALGSEVTNEGHVAGDPIASDVRSDFSNEPRMSILLRRGTGEHAPCVQAAYFCGPARALGYAAAVGGRRAGQTAPFGDNYYLDSYERAIAALRGEATQSCMVRYVVVVGRQGMLLGRDTDRADTSAMTRHVGMIKPIVRASAKARDADGKWAKTCDALGRGRLAIETGGSRHTMEPRLCVQRVSSFLPLEYCGGAGSVEACPPVSSKVSYTRKHEHSD